MLRPLSPPFPKEITPLGRLNLLKGEHTVGTSEVFPLLNAFNSCDAIQDSLHRPPALPRPYPTVRDLLQSCAWTKEMVSSIVTSLNVRACTFDSHPNVVQIDICDVGEKPVVTADYLRIGFNYGEALSGYFETFYTYLDSCAEMLKDGDRLADFLGAAIHDGKPWFQFPGDRHGKSAEEIVGSLPRSAIDPEDLYVGGLLKTPLIDAVQTRREYSNFLEACLRAQQVKITRLQDTDPTAGEITPLERRSLTNGELLFQRAKREKTLGLQVTEQEISFAWFTSNPIYDTRSPVNAMNLALKYLAIVTNGLMNKVAAIHTGESLKMPTRNPDELGPEESLEYHRYVQMAITKHTSWLTDMLSR